MELKVLILDDEEIILEGLCSFPWERYGCKVSGKATNGLAGLEEIKKQEPDLIVSDIKMPEMDGLAFAKEARALLPDVEIVFLTGYDNFEFARKAIKISAAEYLLKPVDMKEMHHVVEKITTKIYGTRQKISDYKELRKKYKEALPVVKNKVISDLIHGRYSDYSNIKRRLSSFNIYLRQFAVLYGRPHTINRDVQMDLDEDLFNFVICNVCEEILEKYGAKVYYEIGAMGYCFLVSFSQVIDSVDCEKKCIDACEEMKESLKEVLQMDISFGVSNSSLDVSLLSEAYSQAVDACERCAYLGEESEVLAYADVVDLKRSSWQLNDGEKNRILSELVRGNVETAKMFISQVFMRCDEIEASKFSAMELLMTCYRYLNNGITAAEEKKERYSILSESLKKIHNSYTKNGAVDVLKNALMYFSNLNSGATINRNEHMAGRIYEYVEHNYIEDLSLDFLADQFKMSKTYINRLLKNYCGKSFLEVLVDMRMKKAEQLLVSGEMKVYEIAKSVGYHDQSYFIRVFKKYYGVTPNAYKKI